ncbi:MAG: methyltransferase domain-containing protein [Desulfobacteraceae bacterium]|nr:methyltransferase domain-containing protein [Desulfobacteraceae bacterium]
MENTSFKETSAVFWNKMAGHYPLPFEEKTLRDTQRVIALAREKGVAVEGRTLLDIGCGTGIFTLPLAREAMEVTGLDSSPAMIERLKAQADLHGMANVNTRVLSWKEADLAKEGFEKAFDGVWASMTPAIQTENDFFKMEQCAKHWCVYIGWGRKRENPFLQSAFEMHGLQFGPPPGAFKSRDILMDMGRSPSLDLFGASWDWKGTAELAVESMAGHIEMQGRTADRRKLLEFARSNQENGLVRHTTHVEQGILVWQVK